MKQLKTGSVLLVLVAVAFAGCAKKSSEQASITGTGFDSVSSNEDLAQLPQSTSITQQSGVEVLPIEMSPVTQPSSVAASLSTASMDSGMASTDTSSLSRDQLIQTALKSAGLYNGNIDGKIGPASKRAIEEFQRTQNLKVDGKVGPMTWAALEPYIHGNPGATASNSSDPE